MTVADAGAEAEAEQMCNVGGVGYAFVLWKTDSRSGKSERVCFILYFSMLRKVGMLVHVGL